jgi:predicted Zn-dependent protease
MYKILLIPLFLFTSGDLISESDIPSPRLGDTLNQTITLDQEEKIGRNIYRNLQKHNYIINNFLIYDYITYLGNKLSRNILLERDYLFFITKSKDVNAFAVPGGFMGINGGLVVLTQNEAQLAGVISHELGHVVLRHSAEMMANSNVNSIPMWIGIFAGLLAGQTEASIASIKAGIGLSVQNNINLVRENEIESDNFAVSLMLKSNYDLNEMAKFFRLMQGDSNNQTQVNEYFLTHPLYKNRISTIKKRAIIQNNPIINSSDDYHYVKNILMNMLGMTVDNSSSKNQAINNHRKALSYVSKGNYIKAKKVLQPSYDKNNYNIYVASLMSEILWLQNEKKLSKKILEKILTIYPNNNAINNQLYFLNIKDSINLKTSTGGLAKLMKNNIYNPDLYKLLAEGYTKLDNNYQSKLALINYYNLKGNIPMAFKVIDDGLKAKQLNDSEKDTLKNLKNSILCDSNPPLEPIFGDKTCN